MNETKRERGKGNESMRRKGKKRGSVRGSLRGRGRQGGRRKMEKAWDR